MNRYVRRAAYTLGGLAALNVPGAIGGYIYAANTEKTSPQMKTVYPSPPSSSRKRKRVKTVSKKVMKKTRRTLFKKTPRKRVVFKRKPKTKWRVTKTSYAPTGVSTSTFVGRTARPTKGGTKWTNTVFLKQGYETHYEKHGTVTDPTAVYIYHNNYDQTSIAKALVGAILRRLLAKAGIQIDNQYQEIPLTYTDDSANHRIVYTTRDPVTGALGTGFFTIANNTTFNLLVSSMFDPADTNGMLPGTHFERDMSNSSPTGFLEPHAISLVTVGSPFVTRAIIYLQNEMVTLKAQSKLVFQNRTKGANATGDDLDRVDNQPLKGMIYEFRNGDPRLRTSATLNTSIEPAPMRDLLYGAGWIDGICAFGSVNQTRTLENLPNPKIWKNISGATKTILDPGVMKSAWISSMYTKSLPELLKKLRVNVEGPSGQTYQKFSQLSGMKSQIIGFEEYLRTPSTNHIVVIYEQAVTFGAYTHPKKQKAVLFTDNVFLEQAWPQWVPSAP